MDYTLIVDTLDRDWNWNWNGHWNCDLLRYEPFIFQMPPKKRGRPSKKDIIDKTDPSRLVTREFDSTEDRVLREDGPVLHQRGTPEQSGSYPQHQALLQQQVREKCAQLFL